MALSSTTMTRALRSTRGAEAGTAAARSMTPPSMSEIVEIPLPLLGDETWGESVSSLDVDDTLRIFVGWYVTPRGAMVGRAISVVCSVSSDRRRMKGARSADGNRLCVSSDTVESDSTPDEFRDMLGRSSDSSSAEPLGSPDRLPSGTLLPLPSR